MAMNNVEIADDFIKTVKTQFDNIKLDARDKMLINMAVNHACLIMRDQGSHSDENNE